MVSTCGRNGIFLHRPTDEAWGSDDGIFPTQVQRHNGVACRYIDPPLLIGGLKFDMRLYVLVTSIHPLVVYLYGDGITRFATEPYDLSATTSGIGLERQCMHLTNVSITKNSEAYTKNVSAEEDGSGSKWSLPGLRRRLNRLLGEGRATAFWRDVDDLLVKTLIAAEPALSEAAEGALPAAARGEPVRSCFQIFGIDVMPDSSGKPWLLEVNCDPQMTTPDPLSLRIKSSMLVDTLNVVGMPLPHDTAQLGDMDRWAQTATSDRLHASSTRAEVAEAWALHSVNSEFERSKSGQWRRLLPSSRSIEYLPLMNQTRSLNWLPFEV